MLCLTQIGNKNLGDGKRKSVFYHSSWNVCSCVHSCSVFSYTWATHRKASSAFLQRKMCRQTAWTSLENLKWRAHRFVPSGELRGGNKLTFEKGEKLKEPHCPCLQLRHGGHRGTSVLDLYLGIFFRLDVIINQIPDPQTTVGSSWLWGAPAELHSLFVAFVPSKREPAWSQDQRLVSALARKQTKVSAIIQALMFCHILSHDLKYCVELQ